MKDRGRTDSIGYPAATIHGGLSPKTDKRSETSEREPSLTICCPRTAFNSNLVDTLSQLPIQRLPSTKHIASANGATTSVPVPTTLALRELFPQASFHAYTATATPWAA